MGKKMLIDAAHREETRVVVLDNNRIDEFDYESANKRQLKGNIYLAKVTRVEPSLQAAFVDYGGNRHGFLAFSEIHPDYYQVPVADREALLEIAAEERRESERLEASDSNGASNTEEPEDTETKSPAEEDASVWKSAAKRSEKPETGEDGGVWTSAFNRSVERGDLDEAYVEDTSGDEEEVAEARPRKRRYAKRYKIQEVIKRRQVMLVQVVKEERGNKGAAVTTYLSLAGRYGVLMPNTNRGGGISRKIAQVGDRKRLRDAVSELKVPDGMGLIIRTAGAQRTKAEIKRDYDYLLRLWENVRELTLKSTAPALVYEEGSLIKRSIRDLYNKDIDTIMVEGEEGYREAKDFMKMLIPSHAKNVRPYREPTPLYQRFQVESHLESMFNPVVQLKSGGYIVIDPTEALISIDVNSGRATREHSIEETALKTNLEAAEEAARQFRLRDLAGLIVIDFIDMEEHRNNRAVERKLKECLKDDRARIQVGRISMFGLLEMSRQRMRAGLHESGTIICPHCQGIGRIRSLENIVLNCLRAIEEEGMKARTANATLKVPTDVGMYLLNNKRGELHRMEEQYSLHVVIDLRPELGPMESELVRGESLSKAAAEEIETAVRFDGGDTPEEEVEIASDDDDTTSEKPKRKRRPRRGRDKGEESDTKEDSDPAATSEDGVETADVESPAAEEAVAAEDAEDEDDEDRKPRRRRRGRRGGRRNRRKSEGDDEASTEDVSEDAGDTQGDGEVAASDETPSAEPVVVEITENQTEADSEIEESAADISAAPAAKAPAEAVSETESDVAVLEASNDDQVVDTADAESEAATSNKPKRRGWWQGRSGTKG